ncbi:hypothetical protein SLE2022_140330 [Rubroshorea leprosula]
MKERGQENSTPFSDDLIFGIFFRLPVKSLLRFVCLSNSWSKVIADSQFFALQLHHAKKSNKEFLLQISENPLKLQSISSCPNGLHLKPEILEPQSTSLYGRKWSIVGSYNGVLCLWNSTTPQPYRQLAFLNPSIKKLKLLPLSPTCLPTYHHHPSVTVEVEFGFGYDSSTNDFKVVRILYESQHWRWKQVHVYSLKNNIWTTLTNLTNPLPSYHLLYPRAVVNGAFTCLASKVSPGFLILSFNFDNETFEENKLPDYFHGLTSKHYDIVGMMEVKGRLSLLFEFPKLSHFAYFEKMAKLELWMMVQKSVWAKHLVFHWTLHPIHHWIVMNDPEMLMLTQTHFLSNYNVETLTTSDFGVVNFAYPLHVAAAAAAPYTPSLALLGDPGTSEWNEV